MTGDEMIAAAARLLNSLGTSDLATLEELLHEQVVLDWPFAARGMPTMFSGKRAVIDALARIPDIFDQFEMTANALYPSESSATLTIEASSAGRFRSGGDYNNVYVLLLQFNGGKLALWREYYDPRRVQFPDDPTII